MTAFAARLGYAFKDGALLERALRRGRGGDFQRLEFLGDRALGMVVGAWLFEKFPDADEGELSRRLTGLVCEATLAGVATRAELGKALVLDGGEVLTDGIAADGMEAVLGAVYMDGSLAAVEGVVKGLWAELIELDVGKDAKTRLQEFLQGAKFGLPVYEVVEARGADHDKWFVVKVICDKGDALGEGRSKQAATMAAAAKMMETIDGN